MNLFARISYPFKLSKARQELEKLFTAFPELAGPVVEAIDEGRIDGKTYSGYRLDLPNRKVIRECCIAGHMAANHPSFDYNGILEAAGLQHEYLNTFEKLIIDVRPSQTPADTRVLRDFRRIIEQFVVEEEANFSNALHQLAERVEKALDQMESIEEAEYAATC